MNWIELHRECERVAEARRVARPALAPLPADAPPRRVILAMWQESYLRRADTLQAGLEAGYGTAGVGRWTADRVGRAELSERLAEERIPLAFYLGHGAERGWAGYRGLRLRHLRASAEPLGLVVSLSCSTLAFGRRLVDGGYARAFLGSDGPMGIPGLTRLVGTLADVFSRPDRLPCTAAELIAVTEEHVSRSASVELREAWAQLRLLGPASTTI